MPPQLPHLRSQYWLSQFKSSTDLPEKLKLVEECSERLAGLITGDFTPFSRREIPENHPLYALLANKWLSDELINACRSYLTEKLSPSSTIRIVNSFFLSKLHQIRQENSSRSPQSQQLDRDIRASSVHTLLIPVHLPGHWTLVVINLLEQTYCYTDTLDLSNCAAPPNMVDNLEWWLSGLFGSQCVLKPVFRWFETDQQTDCTSCGLAVMTTMSHIALSTPSWTQAQVNSLRMEWFLKFTEPSNNNQVKLKRMLDDNTQSDSKFKVMDPMGGSVSTEDTTLSDTLETQAAIDTYMPLLNPSSLGTPTVHWLDSHNSDPPTSESSGFLGPSNPELDPDAQECDLQPPSIAKPSPKPLKSLKQSTLNFPKVGPEEYHQLECQRALKRKAEDEALAELEEKIKEEKFLEKRQKARDKKRHWRQSKRAKSANGESKKDPSTHPGESLSPLSPTSDVTDSAAIEPLLTCGVAELSRPHRRSKLILSGNRAEEAPAEAKHVNWMNPFLFNIINAAAIAVGYPWSPAEIVKRLKLQHPQLFEKLRPQRVSDWKDATVKDRLKWKDSVLKAVQCGNHPGGTSTRQPLLIKYPQMVSILKERMLGLRVAGSPLDTATIRGFMIATMSEYAPELFECKVSQDKPFRCSSEFVRVFLHNELNWSLRRPTQAAQKVPANVQGILMQAFLRMACAVRDENIPSCCIVNSDQTQVVYSAGTQYTWHTQGDKQVPVLGKDEKRAFTLLVGASNDGQLLPLQAIYQGMSNASLPHRNSPGYAEALACHVFFVVSMTTTYWSTLETMKAYVILILVPFFKRMIATHQLPEDQRCIWQIDVWSVHRSEKFRDWLSATYPWIILQYVPGGCTGLFQACDVGLQKIAKAAIRQKSLADIINETTTALRNGANPTTFVNDKSIGTLRNRSVAWINEAIRVIDKPELIQKAFKLCAVPNTQFNLSYESLTSHEARQAIRELKTSNPVFHAEITAGRPAVLSEQDVEPEDDNSSIDELSITEHTRIVMESTTATEIVAQLDEADQGSDTESTYEPPATALAGPSHASEPMVTRRELPRRAAKENTSYVLQEWWNRLDLDN